MSYYTLPRHWELSLDLHASGIGQNVLVGGDFDAPRPADRRGVPVTTLPGWTEQQAALDDVVMSAGSSPARRRETPPVPPVGPRPRYQPTSALHRIEPTPSATADAWDPVLLLGRHPEAGGAAEEGVPTAAGAARRWSGCSWPSTPAGPATAGDLGAD